NFIEQVVWCAIVLKILFNQFVICENIG
ncbi:hypothetical protein D047_2316B, partial [Vibrio parahaemolyticus VPTS-2010_2]